MAMEILRIGSGGRDVRMEERMDHWEVISGKEVNPPEERQVLRRTAKDWRDVQVDRGSRFKRDEMSSRENSIGQ